MTKNLSLLLVLFFLPLLFANQASAMVLPDLVFARKPLNSTPAFDIDNDIFTMDVNGGNFIRLTDNKTTELDPFFSPTDDLISFYANPLQVFHGGIFVMDFQGGNIQELSGGDFGGGSEQSWSPDGTQLVFVKHTNISGMSDLYIVNRDGTGLHKISQDSGAHIQPRWSPSGKHISYVSYEGTHIIDVNGNNKVDVAAKADYSGLWSPDGTKFYFNDKNGLWVVNPDGTNPVKIWSLGKEDTFSRYKIISHDGKTIVFTDESIPFAFNRLVFLNLETLETTFLDLTGYNLANSNLNWSKDKRFLFFTSFNSSKLTTHIFRYDYKTGEIVQLTDGDFIYRDLHLRPSYSYYSNGTGSNVVPEPVSVVLFGAGAVGMLAQRRFHRKKL